MLYGWIIAPMVDKAAIEGLGIKLGPHDGEAFKECEVSNDDVDHLDPATHWGRWRWSFGSDKKAAKKPPKNADLIAQEEARAVSVKADEADRVEKEKLRIEAEAKAKEAEEAKALADVDTKRSTP